MKTPEALRDAEATAISEFPQPVSEVGTIQVTLYDKKAALDVIARHLGMVVRPPRREEDGAPADLAEDACEVLARRLARLAAGGAKE